MVSGPDKNPKIAKPPPQEQLVHKRQLRSGNWVRTLFTQQRVVMALVIPVAVIFGIVLPFVDFKIQFVMTAMFPAMVLGITVLLNAYVGVCGFLFYEFFRPDSVFPALASLRLVLIIEVVTLAAWIIHLVVRRQKIKWHSFNWVYIAFIAVIGTTVLTAMNNRYAYDTFQGMAITFLMFLIATNVVNTMRRLQVLVAILLMIHAYYAVRGIVTGGFVGGSLMGDENDLALAMNVFMPFAYFFFLSTRKGWLKTFYLAMLISTVFATVVSLSRGGTVGLIAIIFYCIAKSKRKMVSIGIILLLGLVVLAFAPDKYWKESSTITDTNQGTARTRLDFWSSAVRMWLDYPLTGVGAANGPIRMPEYYRGDLDPATRWGRTFHGTMPQVLAETGTLGMGAYLTMIGWAVILMRRARRRRYRQNEVEIHSMSDAIVGAILAFVVTGTFLSTAYYPQLWTMFLLTMALHHVSSDLALPEETPEKKIMLNGQLVRPT